jgi:hypothetical protein
VELEGEQRLEPVRDNSAFVNDVPAMLEGYCPLYGDMRQDGTALGACLRFTGATSAAG